MFKTFRIMNTFSKFSKTVSKRLATGPYLGKKKNILQFSDYTLLTLLVLKMSFPLGNNDDSLYFL